MSDTLEQIALRVANEACCEIWGVDDLVVPPSKDMEDFVKANARRLVAALQQEPVAWRTHHDEPMLFPTFDEAAMYCEDNEPPEPLYAAPVIQPPQEPVAWRCTRGGETYHFGFSKPTLSDWDTCIPLYAAPVVNPDWQMVPKELPDSINDALGKKYGYPPYGWKSTYKRILSEIAAAPEYGK